MYDERAQLELAYTNQLRAWSRKWHSELVKSQEYGTNKKVWDQAVTTGKEYTLLFYLFVEMFFFENSNLLIRGTNG